MFAPRAAVGGGRARRTRKSIGTLNVARADKRIEKNGSSVKSRCEKLTAVSEGAEMPMRKYAI